MTDLDVLRRYARAPARPRSQTAACELCAGALSPSHAHVVDLASRQLRCACTACATLMSYPGAGGGTIRAVPTRVLADPRWQLRETQWAELGIPVQLAFVFRDSTADRWAAFYPSPAGATEASLDEVAWQRLVAEQPLLQEIAPDVEALLVRGRADRSGFDCLLVPVDACYSLVALVRRHFSGFDGGPELRRELDQAFDELVRRSKPLVGRRQEAAR